MICEKCGATFAPPTDQWRDMDGLCVVCYREGCERLAAYWARHADYARQADIDVLRRRETIRIRQEFSAEYARQAAWAREVQP